MHLNGTFSENKKYNVEGMAIFLQYVGGSAQFFASISFVKNPMHSSQLEQQLGDPLLGRPEEKN